MKKTILLVATLLATTPSYAQGFINLKFESADISSDTPPFGFLPWSEAVPGWGHGDGQDTQIVYHGLTHVGVTPWYLLVDAAQNQPSLEGSFSVAMKNGNATSDPQSPWVNDFISQTGTIPFGTHTVTLFASGSLGIQWNGNSLNVVALGGNLYAADVSAWAGTSGELKIVNLGTDQLDILTIDNIQFSTSVVPEPDVLALLSIGIVPLFLWLRRKRQMQQTLS